LSVIKCCVYKSHLKQEWDSFIGRARNGNFLFFRDYMEYHAHRFPDHSVMFYDGQEVVACLPAAQLGDTLNSHAGLSYGGLVMRHDIRSSSANLIVTSLFLYLQDCGLEHLIYSPMPYIYHSLPTEPDLEALTTLGARVVATKAVYTLRAGNAQTMFSKNRLQDLKRFRRSGFKIKQSTQFEEFMTLCEEHLEERFDAKPVHRAKEISALANSFPNHIQLFCVHEGSQVIAGVIVYRNANCAKIQYLAHNEFGRDVAAVTAIHAYILENVLCSNTWLELGHAMTPEGKLNLGVQAYKESLGGCVVQVRTYHFAVKHSKSAQA
jgi:hypothetical protein